MKQVVSEPKNDFMLRSNPVLFVLGEWVSIGTRWFSFRARRSGDFSVDIKGTILSSSPREKLSGSGGHFKDGIYRYQVLRSMLEDSSKGFLP